MTGTDQARDPARTAETNGAQDWLQIRREGDLRRDGVALLRGAIDPVPLRGLLSRAQDIFTMLEGMSEEEMKARGVADFRFHGALNLAAVDPELNILGWMHPMLMPSVSDFLDCEQLGYRNNIARRIYPTRPESSSSFHQDLQFLKPYGGQMVTVWITLEACDGTRPGLEILPKRLPGLAGRSVGDYLGDSPVFKPYVDHGPKIAHDSAVALTEAGVAELAGGQPLWRPQLAVGDILVFDGYTIHRSALAPGMTQTRTSVELRCVPHRLAAVAEQGATG